MTVDIAQDREGSELVIALSGELDAMAGSAFTERIASVDLEAPGLTLVTVDLHDLTFMDSFGVSTLIRFHRRADEGGLDFRVVNVHETQRQVLDIVGLLQYLHVDDDPEHVQ